MIAYLSLGSNISPRHEYMEAACRLIGERVGKVLRRSSDFFSAPWGYQSDHEYLNIVLRVQTSLSPKALLQVTQRIERELGRTEKNVYADRTIDVDILMCYAEDGTPLIVDSSELTVPHPRMREREFVMVPLREVFEEQNVVS